MDAERRREIYNRVIEQRLPLSQQVFEAIDLAEKATAEEIFKAIEEEYKMGLVPVNGLDYWESFKKKFDIGSEIKDGVSSYQTLGASKGICPSEMLDAEEENPSPNKGVLEILKENMELNRRVRTMGTEILQHLDSIELMLKGIEDSYAEGLRDGDNSRAWRKDAEWKRAVEKHCRCGCIEKTPCVICSIGEKIFKEMGC